MATENPNEEIVTVRYHKHSMWTQFKIVAFWDLMVLMGVGFAWTIMNLNLAMAKASGLVGEVVYYFGGN